MVFDRKSNQFTSQIMRSVFHCAQFHFTQIKRMLIFYQIYLQIHHVNIIYFVQ